MHNIQNILTKEFDSFTYSRNLTFQQLKTLHHIKMCHTEELGFNSYRCEECHHTEIHYNSCGDRNCPMCQYHKREEWISKFETFLLDIPYFHIVFTLPEELNPIIYQNQEKLYNILFKTASKSLMKLAKKKYGQLGFTFILHTWGQNLAFHPHIHCIVSGGGLKQDENGDLVFKRSSDKFLVSVKALSKIFRGMFLDSLKKAKQLTFVNDCANYNNRNDFDSLITEMYHKDWVVYAKKPFNNNRAVLEYIGRYSHRIAISNNRIVNYDEANHQVTFTYKDYRDNSKKKEMTLSALEFLRRFSMHILPSHFMKIRHYGFMSNTTRNTLIPVCRQLLPASYQDKSSTSTEPVSYEYCCPKCGKKMLITYRTSPYRRINTS